MNATIPLFVALFVIGQEGGKSQNAVSTDGTDTKSVATRKVEKTETAGPGEMPKLVRWDNGKPVWDRPLPDWARQPQVASGDSPPPANEDSPTKKSKNPGDLTWQEICLAVSVLIYSLILFGMLANMKSRKVSWDLQSFKIMATLLLVTAALFVMPAAYTDQQAAPLFGLLGTLAGYILSKSEGSSNKSALRDDDGQGPDPSSPKEPPLRHVAVGTNGVARPDPHGRKKVPSTQADATRPKQTGRVSSKRGKKFSKGQR
ncbi:MAG: hypothetical protein NVSMB9_30540 [Isosphaeraceae bacterium]